MKKETILLTSYGSSGLATSLAIITVLSNDMTNMENAAKGFLVAALLGVFGISSFFVGLCYPLSKQRK